MRTHVASHKITAEGRTIHACANNIYDTSEYGVTVQDVNSNVRMYVPADVIEDMANALAAERIDAMADPELDPRLKLKVVT